MLKELSVAVALNYVEDEETGERVPRSPEEIEALRRLLRTAVNLPAEDAPNSNITSKFTLEELRFDDSQARLLAREQLWENITSIVKTLLPLILLFALGYFVYIFFQSALRSTGDRGGGRGRDSHRAGYRGQGTYAFAVGSG